MKVRAIALAPGLVFLAACATAGLGGGAVDPRQCVMEEVSRDSLRLEDGRLLYAEASAFVADERGRVLLAGVPNFRTTISPEDVVTNVESDAVLGAVIEPDGSARAVEIPVDGRIGGVRAAPAAGGGWHVLFGEVPDFTGDTRPDETERIWYGRFDGEAWSDVEMLPSPGAGTLTLRLASSLVAGGDTLAWASRLSAPGLPQRLALFQRRGGAWTVEVLPVFHSYAEPAFLADRGLSLFVVGSAPLPGSYDSNSLLLWTRTPGWRLERRLVHGPDEGEVDVPAVAAYGAGWSVNWHTGAIMGNGESKVLAGVAAEAEPAPLVLDSNAWWTQYPNRPARLRGEMMVWVTEHGDEDSRRVLRFTTRSDSAAALLGSIPSPYRIAGFTRAAALPSDEVLVTGRHVSQNHRVASLLIRARLRCAAW